MCGGAVGLIAIAAGAIGPSPRVRGSPERNLQSGLWGGTIPACAGEPMAWLRSRPALGDHPRVCGGAADANHWAGVRAGPSPRVRGSPFDGEQPVLPPGPIPACAGEPSRTGVSVQRSRDHPRVCGGANNVFFARSPISGPFPRVRGSPSRILLSGELSGTIPACAGEPPRLLSVKGDHRDHPRVCGGADLCGSLGMALDGPSPRVRGSRRMGSGWDLDLGTIPACAGEPRERAGEPLLYKDHPRVCGGAQRGTGRTQPWQGPSPRVRGSHNQHTLRRDNPGTIPACAGEPCGQPVRSRASGDHPRVCGGAPARKFRKS